MSYEANLDAELRPGLAMFEAIGGASTELDHETILIARATGAEMLAAMAAQLPPNGRVKREDRVAPGPNGGVRVRVYRPAAASKALPCVYWIHGGGMVTGSIEMDDLACEAYVERVGCVVVSVDYRLAPEHPHPAPVEDCYAGLVWTAAMADELQIDGARLAVAGASAGGGLAAATVLLARDRGGPPIAFQLLVYPMLDDRDATPSTIEFSRIPSWSREHNRSGWVALLGERAGGEDVSPYAAAARARNLSNLPPALIQVGELEVFRDEDIDYAARLLRAGVPTELHVFPGAYHGCDIAARPPRRPCG